MTLAVDTYGWIHKATVSCAQELCQDQPTQKYITAVVKKINMLRHFGVEPYLVFDGASLPTKARTAAERRQRREEAREKANDMVKKGKTKLAWKEFMKAAGVTFEMAKSIMVEMDRLRVKYVVAPYEADPQMVYLEKLGLVDGILSEDSDLLVFGCKRLITKLNDFGECIEISKSDFQNLPIVSNFTESQLRLVAMLSGCDYTKGVPGVGLKTSFKLVHKYVTLDRVLLALRAQGKKIPESFHDEVLKANLAFQYQKVFNPTSKSLATLNQYPNDFACDMTIVEECCGHSFDNIIHVRIAQGEIHPNSHKLLFTREQNVSSLKSKSVTDSNVSKHKITIDNFFTKGFRKSFQVQNTPQEKLKDEFLPKQSQLQKNNVKNPRFEKLGLSPLSKRVKSIVPQTLTNLSKFFAKPPIIAFADVSGDSDITENSPHKDKPIDTTTILNNVDDLDNNVFNAIDSNDAHVSQDFDINEDDDEIEESPIKKNLFDQLNIRKILRETFLYNPNIDHIKLELSTDFDSDSSIDLKVDDLELKENVKLPTQTTNSLKSKPVPSKRNRLSNFAYTA